MPDDDDKKSIVARRARFVAAALATLTGGMASCDGCSDVEIVDDDGSGTGAAQPQPCLSPALGGGGEGGMPQPCLGQQLGGGGEGGAGGRPQPCLDVPLGGGGEGGAFPCLAPRK